MQEFVLKTRLYFGENALNCLSQLPYCSALLVTDPFFAQNGVADILRSIASHMQIAIFDEVQPDPPLSLIAKGVAKLQESSPQAVIALGGGSAIDCAKGIVCMAGSSAELIAIPTTSGTGSEVTKFAILTHDNIKHPLIDDHLRPTIAILDPRFLEKLPSALIADAGMDAIAHCIEALAAKNASPFSDALAIHACRILIQKLPLSYQGDVNARNDIHAAATMAGIAFDNAGLGICHALSHALGGMFHIAHGRLNAILLPAVMRFQDASAYLEVAKQCGFSGTQGLIFALQRLRKTLHLPDRLTSTGLARDAVLHHLDSICDAAMHDACMNGNSKTVTAQDLAHIVREVL